jgi:hypothetical protein
MYKLKDFSLMSPVKEPFSTKLPTQKDLIYHDNYESLNIKLNSKNYRCDEFSDNHDGLHMLFSGCSVTYGTGLLENEVWSKKLYSKIKKEKKVSGYFNLAIPSSNIFEIVINIFRYISEFGKPDAIFVCWPSIRRYGIKSNRLKKEICYGVYANNFTDDFYTTAKLHSFHYILMLEEYCKTNNIKLYTFSYDQKFFMEVKLGRVFMHKNQDLVDSVAKICSDSTKKDYLLKARDNSHYGEAYHTYWSYFCYSLYKKEK